MNDESVYELAQRIVENWPEWKRKAIESSLQSDEYIPQDSDYSWWP
jgi:hypothetical protein